MTLPWFRTIGYCLVDPLKLHSLSAPIGRPSSKGHRMRALTAGLGLAILFSATGCNILAGYLYKAEHFRFGTVLEKELGQSVEHVFKNVQFVLKERNFSIKRAEQANDEQAEIWSVKDGLQVVFDIKGVGEGCVVHLEMEQAGEHQLGYALLRDIELMP